MDKLAFTALASIDNESNKRAQITNSLANVSTIGFKDSFSLAEQSIQIKGDKDTSTGIRYKYGRNLNLPEKSGLRITDPGNYLLPDHGINIDYIIANNFLPKSDETWKRKPYKRSDLEDLATIKVNMSEQEIEKRIRATYYTGKPAPFIELHGHRFEYNPDR